MRSELITRTNEGKSEQNGPRTVGGNSGSRAVLLVLTHRELPDDTIAHALRVSAALGAELHVLRVLRQSRLRALLNPSRRATQAVESLLAFRATRKWFIKSAGRRPGVGRIRVRRGRLVAEVVRHSRALGADLIVLAPSKTSVGKAAAEIACRTSTPVLVSRPRRQSGTFVLATSLEHAKAPVLRVGAALGRALGAKIVAIHSVPPLLATFAMEAGWPVMVPPSATARDARRAALDRVARRVAPASVTVVSSGPDPAQAILREAMAREADTIVLGVRHRSRLGRIVLPSTAGRVVRHADCSVLVVPVSGRRRSSSRKTPSPGAWA